ncbi:GNAT family N-acetyltransferase [Microcoleus sp. N9_A1]|uniref:GNAT family N-acetyltransferase n=1 Tax=Microcoleus sp. N9_A1 TaxID=3055380 RepID=UPI002FD10C93
MYDYIVLDSLNASTYKHLTYPWFQERLDRLSSQNLTNIALGVALQGQPVGLVLAEYPTNQNQANILSLIVAQEHRQQGLGTALLMQIEEILKKHGCQQLNLLYSLNLTTPILERMLKQQNWETASFYSLQCLTNRESIKQAPFLNRYVLPNKFTIFPWVDLTAQERTKIKQRENGLNYPDELCPFQDRIEAVYSIGLRDDLEEVIGWSIVQQMPNGAIYKALFIKPDFRAMGLGIHLLAASINRRLTDKKGTEAMFIVLAENKIMVRFVNRHLAPYLTSINSFWKSSKLMASSTSIEQNQILSHSIS